MGSETKSTLSGLLQTGKGPLGTHSVRRMHSVLDSGCCESGLCVTAPKSSCDNKLFFAASVC